MNLIHTQIPSSLIDGWIILGFLCTFVIALLQDSHKDLGNGNMAVISFLGFFTLFGGLNFPWYQFIIYPILALNLGITLSYFLTKPKIEFNLMFFLVTISSLLFYSAYQRDWLGYLNHYRLLFILLVLAGCGGCFIKKHQSALLRIGLILMLGYGLFLSTRIVNNLDILWPQVTMHSIIPY